LIVLLLLEKTIFNFNISQYRMPYLYCFNLTKKSMIVPHDAKNLHYVRNIPIFLNDGQNVINIAIIKIRDINLIFEFLFSQCLIDIIFILLGPLLLLKDSKSKCISLNHSFCSFHLLIFLLNQNLLLSVLSK
jgi:hypothetical protein